MKKINNYKTGFLLLIGVLIGLVSKAQSIKNLSLEQAIDLSLKNSNMLKLANAKIAEAVATTQQAKDNRLPDAKASASYLRVNNPDYKLKLKLNSSGKQAPSVSVNEVSYAMLNASYPLFSGFRIKYGLESAKYLEQAAKLDADNQKQEIVLNTVNAYANLYKAMKTVDLIHERLKQEDQRVKDFTSLEKNGLLAKNDLLKAQLQQANVELTLIDAQNNLKIANVNMNILLGLPEETVIVADSAFYATKYETGTFVDWEKTALTNRKDIAALIEREKATALAIKSTKGEYYPGVALTGGLVAANIPGVLTINDALNGGIGIQYNIASLWKTNAKITAAKTRLQEVQYNQTILSDEIKMQINEAYQNYLISLKKIEVYNQAIDQANENYRISKNKFNNNVLSTTELLEADVLQLQSNLNYVFAKIDAWVTYKKLLYTSGKLAK